MVKGVKKSLAVILAGIMLLGLAGCGKDSGNKAEKKEFVYIPTFTDFPEDIQGMSSYASDGDILYIQGNTWDETTNISTNYVYKYDLIAGTTEKLEVPLAENASVYKIAVNSSGNLLMIVNNSHTEGGEKPDGTTENTGSEAEAAKEDSTDSAAGNMAFTDSDNDVQNLELSAVSSSSTVIISETPAAGGADSSPAGNEDSPVITNTLDLMEISTKDGSVINSFDLTEAVGGAESYVQHMAVDKQDNVYLYQSNYNGTTSEETIFMVDKNGQMTGKITCDNWISSMFASKEGDVYILSYGTTGLEMKLVDPQKKSLGTAVQGMPSNGNGYFAKGIEKSIIGSDGSVVFTFDITSGEKDVLFNWLDANIYSDGINALGQLADGRIWAVLNQYNDTNGSGMPSVQLVTVKKEPAANVPEKEEITYGALYLDSAFKKNIVNFNKTNEKYHITVKEYLSDSVDYNAALSNFNNELASGKAPDIIDISGINYSQYANKGLLEDLYTYMDKDGIKKDDYFQNVLKAFESEKGQLWGITPQFGLSTTLAKESVVGNRSGWTLSEMLDFVESHGDASNIFQYGTRDSVFYYCIYFNLDQFINWDTGECSFNGEDFIRTLEFAAKLPEEANYNQEDNVGIGTLLKNNEVLLMQTSISSMEQFQMMMGLMGEKAVFVGYPNIEKKGNLISPAGGCMAINSKSKNKDGAWEFVKTVLTDEYQNKLVLGNNVWNFPIKRSAMDKLMAESMIEDTYKDESGNDVVTPKTTWGYDDFEMEIYAAKQEEVDALMELINSSEKTYSYNNTEIENIIKEEVAAFFKGQKSAKDTADIIQSRMQVYVNENR